MIEPAIGLIAGHNQRRSDEIQKLRETIWYLIKADTHPAIDKDPAIDAMMTKAAADHAETVVALRAAIAEHDKKCRCTWFATFPLPAAAQVSAYKAAVPFGSMGQIATPHDGGQAASGRAEPTHCQHGVSDQNNCAQCDKLRAEGGVK